MLGGVVNRVRQASNAVDLLMLLAILSVLGPALVLAGVTLQSRALFLESTERRAAGMADLLAQHASATFDTYNFAFSCIDEHLRRSDDVRREEPLHAYLSGLDGQLKSSDGLMVLDRTWTISAHSRHFPSPKLDTRDREFVRILQARAGEPDDPGAVSGRAGLAISLPFRSRITGDTILVVSRALKDGAGRLDGGMAITLSQSFFEAIYRTVPLAEGDRIVLRRADTRILAQFPSQPPPQRPPQPPVGESEDVGAPDLVSATPVSFDGSTPRVEGARTVVSPGDGIRRIASLHQVAGYPVFLEVGFSIDSVLKPWLRQIPVNLAIAGLASLVLFALTRLAMVKTGAEGRMQELLLAEAHQRMVAESALRQSQKMEALGQLTGGLAHDFNNLLNVVLINLELACKWRADGRPADEPLFEGYLRGAAQGAERGAALTRRLLAFAYRRETQTEDVPVSELIFGLFEMLGQAAGASVRITLDCPHGLRPARADANELETALLNLVVNARDAMPEGGRLAIAVREESVAPAGLSAPVPGDYVVLSVRDAGCGMDGAMLARATEPFFTTKEVGKGSGLGLAMADRFASRAGGRLVIDSLPGAGTTVEIWLPAA